MRTATRFLTILATTLILSSPSFAGFAGTEEFLAAVGNPEGAGGTQFFTTVWITDVSSSPVTFTFDFLRTGQANNVNPTSFEDTLQPGQTKMYEDVAGTKLGLTNANGAARITANGELFVSERIYNQPSGTELSATAGQFFSGIPKSFSIGLGESASLQGVYVGSGKDFRYNYVLLETSGANCSVHVRLLDDAGTQLGATDFPLLPYEHMLLSANSLAPSASSENARLVATVTSGAGTAIIAGSQVGNSSPQDQSGFEMSFPDEILAGGGAGVTSLNGLTGALTIAHGANTTVSVAGNTITIDAVSGSGTGLTAVAHDNTLIGGGTGGSPLGVASNLTLTSSINDVIVGNSTALGGSEGGVVGTSGSGCADCFGVHGHGGATGTDGYLGGNDYGVLGVSTDKNGQAVAGNNNFNKTSGVLGFSDAGVLGDATNAGDTGVLGSSAGGTGVVGETTSNDAAYSGVAGIGKNNGVLGRVGSSSAVFPAAVEGLGKAVPGVWGISDSGVGVNGTSTSYYGVFGESETGGVGGVRGDNNSGSGWGVQGGNNVTGGQGYLGGHEYGVLGIAPTTGGAPHFYAGDFQGDVIVTGHLNASGVQLASFPHPTDAAQEIHFVSLTGPEAGTYFRGSGKVVNGFATIDVPESFRTVTNEKGLTVQVTPMGSPAVLYCVKKGLQKIVIQGNSDVDFDYTVNGTRKGFENFSAVASNEGFVPRSANDTGFARYIDASGVAALKANGILNADGSINLETAHRLGWDKRPGWNEARPNADER